MKLARTITLTYFCITCTTCLSYFTKEQLTYWIYSGMALAFLQDKNTKIESIDDLYNRAKIIADNNYEDLNKNEHSNLIKNINKIKNIGKINYKAISRLNPTH